MKTPLFFLTTITLGSIAGVSGNHYFQVKEMVRQHEQNVSSENGIFLVHSPEVDNSIAEPLANIQVTEVPTDLPVAIDTHEVALSEAIAVKLAEQEAKNTREEALLEILTAVRADQKALKQQLAETNRDLAEANFRLDTHSDSFKPLRTDSERPKTLNTLDESDDFQLLPPK